MLNLIQDIVNKGELKKQAQEFYNSKRFFCIQAAYYLGICIYTFVKSVDLINNDANAYLVTFFVIIIATTMIKIVLVYRKDSMVIYPSLLQFIYYPENDQHSRFLIFVINPLFYIVLLGTIRSSTHFVADKFATLFINVLFLYLLPIILELFIFMFLVVIFASADVVADKVVVTKEMEKKLEDEGEDCLICKCEFEKDEILTYLKCKHKFHEDCISTWFKINNACPLCKQTLLQQGSLREIVSKYSE